MRYKLLILASIVILGITTTSGAAYLAARLRSGPIFSARLQAYRPLHLNSKLPAHKPLPTTAKATPPATAPQTQATIPSTPRAHYIGVFVDDSPSDPATAARLNQEKSLGINVVYNYAGFDGTVDQVNAYLAHARSLGISVIISLAGLYDQASDGDSYYQSFPQFGDGNEAVALNVVRNFATNPAVWGFGLTDERPESSDDLGTWRSILADRAGKIRALTTKPLLGIYVGATSPSTTARRSFLTSLRPYSDHLALDYYPVPFQSISRIADIASDLTAVGDRDGWFIAQAFSWNANSDYAATAQGLGFNPALARLPTSAEMTTMAELALTHGAKNVLFYHYHDIAGNSAQIAALRATIAQLRGH